MTTRVIGPIGDGYSPYYKYVVKSGDNGKYEVAFGRQRTKWNYYSIRDEEQKAVGGYWNGFGPFYANITGMPTLNSLFSGSDINKVLGKLSSVARGHDFNLAVNVAQGKQTVNLVVNSLNSIGRALLDARRGNFISAISRFGLTPKGKTKFSTKDVSSRWLELQYGWLPMLGDCYEAAKAYEQSSSSRSQRIRATSGGTFLFEGSQSAPNYISVGTGLKRYSILAELSENLSLSRGLGLTDPLSVAWEVIPYSFVIDWFLPIGLYLENLNIIPKLEGRFLISRLARQDVRTKVILPNIFYAGSSSRFRWLLYDRQVTTSLVVPKPSFVTLPSAMSPRRIWSAMALAHQRAIK